MSPDPAAVCHCFASSARTSAVVWMPPADRSTSEAKSSGKTSRAPQYRMTMAAEAPPHSASVWGRKGTFREDAAAAAASATAATTTITALLERHDQENLDQQDD